MKYQQYTFSGGISAGSRSGYKGAYQDGIGVDIRTDPDSVQSLRKLVKESGTTVTGLVKWMVEYGSDKWMYDDSGKIYKRTSAAAYTNPKSVSSSTGQGIGFFKTLNVDYGWYASSLTIGRIDTLSGTPGFTDAYFETNNLDVDQSQDLGIANTYTVPTSITESATTQRNFTPTKTSINSLSVWVVAKGTGNLTLTIHDSNNAVIATQTIANASLTNGAYNKFTLSTVARVINAEYHFHLTVNTGTTTVGTSTSADLSTVRYREAFAVLFADADYHPMKEFVNYNCIGNGEFLATIDDLEQYDPERLQFGSGERVRALEVIGGSLFIGVWKGTAIGDYETSKIYTWDGISASWNDVIEVSGQINALKNAGNNMLYVLHGTQGELSLYTGGITPLRPLKYLGKGKGAEIYPGAVTVHNKIFYYGISAGTSTTVDRVVYGFGTKNKDYPVAWTKDFIISTGKKASTVQIGCLLGTNESTFLVAWKDGSSYGVDNISSTADTQDSYIKGLIFDRPEIHQQKQSTSVSIRYDPLGPDQSIEVWYKRDGLNEEGSADNPVDSEGFAFLGLADGDSDSTSFYTSFAFNKKWFQLEIKVRLKTEGNESPVFYSWEVPFEIVDNTQLGVINTHE